MRDAEGGRAAGGGPDPGPASLAERHGRGPARGPARLLLGAVLPGAPQLLAGRAGVGAVALAPWLASLAILVLRRERVSEGLTGPVDHQLAVFTLALVLVGTWAWSTWDLRRTAAGGRRRHAQGALGPIVGAFRRNWMAAGGAATVIVLCLTALLAPLLAPLDPVTQGSLVGERLLPPSGRYLLGTDQFARDILSRLLYGARVSLLIGLLAVSIAVSVGTLVGAAAGFVGGRVDGFLMRMVDVVIAFPRLVLLIAVIALFQPSLPLVILVLGLTQWPQMARIIRGEVLSLREREFVQAGRALGFSGPRLLLRHVIPNVAAPIIVVATLGVGDTIILEAILSFLGLGVQAPTPAWGSMVAGGRGHLLGAWWITTFPGLAIVTTVLAFNLAGDGLRDAFDPHLRS